MRGQLKPFCPGRDYLAYWHLLVLSLPAMYKRSSAKALIRIGMCALLVGFGVERTIGAPKATPVEVKAKAKAVAKPKAAKKPKAEVASGKVDAKGALAGTRKALAVMIRAARADKGLDPKTPKNKPFWSATQKLSKQLDGAQKGLAAKNDEFFKGISGARSAEAQMKVAWQLTGSENKPVIDAAKKLGRALAILRTDFSKEADRKKKGGELTAREKEQFAKIKKQQADLLAKVKALETKARKDKGLERGLKKIAADANRVVKAPETVDGFVATLYLLDELEGLLYGYDYYVDKDWRNDWLNVSTWTAAWDPYMDGWTTSPYVWSDTPLVVDIYPSEEFAVPVELSEPEIESEGDFAENVPVEMSEPEQEQVAADENSDPEVESDATDDDDSMEDPSDDEGEDFDGDGDDDGGDADDDGGDDDADGGDDDDDGGGDDDGGDDDGGDDDGGDE